MAAAISFNRRANVQKSVYFVFHNEQNPGRQTLGAGGNDIRKQQVFGIKQMGGEVNIIMEAHLKVGLDGLHEEAF